MPGLVWQKFGHRAEVTKREARLFAHPLSLLGKKHRRLRMNVSTVKLRSYCHIVRMIIRIVHVYEYSTKEPKGSTYLHPDDHIAKTHCTSFFGQIPHVLSRTSPSIYVGTGFDDLNPRNLF